MYVVKTLMPQESSRYFAEEIVKRPSLNILFWLKYQWSFTLTASIGPDSEEASCIPCIIDAPSHWRIYTSSSLNKLRSSLTPVYETKFCKITLFAFTHLISTECRVYASVNLVSVGSGNCLSPVRRNYPNQCWHIFNWNHGNRSQWNSNRNYIIIK